MSTNWKRDWLQATGVDPDNPPKRSERDRTLPWNDREQKRTREIDSWPLCPVVEIIIHDKKFTSINACGIRQTRRKAAEKPKRIRCEICHERRSDNTPEENHRPAVLQPKKRYTRDWLSRAHPGMPARRPQEKIKRTA